MRKLVNKLVLGLSIFFLMGGCIRPQAAIPSLCDSQNAVVDLLSEFEQEELRKLCGNLSSLELRNKRNKSTFYFLQILSTIERYIDSRNGGDREKVAYILGYFKIDANNVLINAHHLGKTLSKCKSSINGSFQRLGYSTSGVVASYHYVKPFIKSCGFHEDDFSLLRQWSCKIRNNQNLPVQAPPVQDTLEYDLYFSEDCEFIWENDLD